MAEPLHVGILGVSHEAGANALEAVLKSPQAEVAAVADRDNEMSLRVGDRLGVPWFDDFRAFVLAPGIDVLLVTTPPFASTEALRLAASKGISVWRTAPPARNFNETVQLAGWFEQTHTPLVVSRGWSHESDELQPEALADRLGDVFLAHANVLMNHDEDLDWRGDRERAGGGVILDQAYALIDLAVSQMGVPDVVSAATARVPQPPETKFRHDTEDSAVLLMRYASGAMVSVTACWRACPSQWHVTLHGERSSVVVEADRMVYWARDGRELGTVAFETETGSGRSVAAFLEMSAAGETAFPSAVASHLATMSVIDAAYLSARTGEPESPLRLFEMQGIAPPRHTENTAS